MPQHRVDTMSSLPQAKESEFNPVGPPTVETTAVGTVLNGCLGTTEEQERWQEEQAAQQPSDGICDLTDEELCRLGDALEQHLRRRTTPLRAAPPRHAPRRPRHQPQGAVKKALRRQKQALLRMTPAQRKAVWVFQQQQLYLRHEEEQLLRDADLSYHKVDGDGRCF